MELSVGAGVGVGHEAGPRDAPGANLGRRAAGRGAPDRPRPPGPGRSRHSHSRTSRCSGRGLRVSGLLPRPCVGSHTLRSRPDGLRSRPDGSGLRFRPIPHVPGLAGDGTERPVLAPRLPTKGWAPSGCPVKAPGPARAVRCQGPGWAALSQAGLSQGVRHWARRVDALPGPHPGRGFPPRRGPQRPHLRRQARRRPWPGCLRSASPPVAPSVSHTRLCPWLDRPSWPGSQPASTRRPTILLPGRGLFHNCTSHSRLPALPSGPARQCLLLASLLPGPGTQWLREPRAQVA